MKTPIKNLVKAAGGSLLLGTLLLTAGNVQAVNWQLVWADEFNGNIGPNWTYDTGGGGWGNNELEYYQPQNATVENGMLVITAKKESVGGSNYTSARLKTQGFKAWKYGKIEARIAMPGFQGSWPAFWMLGDNIGSVGWPTCGEIDIMEQINGNQTVSGSTHWYSGGQADWTSSAGTSIGNFHTYSIEWDPNYIKWFIDGNFYSQFYIGGNAGGTGCFNNNNFFIILNLAVGGNWPGNTINDSALPGKMYVDYVRVYQDLQGSAQASTSTPYFLIINKHSGKALDLSNGNAANGTVLQQWTIDTTTGNERWAVQPTENSDHFELVSYASGKCESVAGDSTSPNALINEWDYVGGDPSQQFDFIDAGNGWFKIKNVRSGLMLDVVNAGTGNGNQLQQYTDNGNDAQLFRLQPWGNYNIKAQVSGRYVCVQNAGSANGSPIIQYDWQNNPWFKWNFVNTSDGWYACDTLNAANKAISVNGGSTTPGMYTQLWDYNSAGEQQSRLVPALNSCFRFYFKHDGQSWDIQGGSTANNTPLTQYGDNSSAAQFFQLERVQ